MAEVTRDEDHVYFAVGNKPTWDLALTQGGTGVEYFACSINDEEELTALRGRLHAAGIAVRDLDRLALLISAGVEFPLPGGQMMRVVIPEDGRTTPSRPRSRSTR